LEESANEDHAHAMKRFEAEKLIFSGRKEYIKNSLRKKMTQSEIEVKTRELEEMQEPKEPTKRRYKTNEASVQKMTELQAANPRGLLLYRDELMGLLNTWSNPGHESDRQYYLEAWNGTMSYSDDKIGRGDTHAASVCVSILGGIQPSKLLPFLTNSEFNNQDDGLSERFQAMVFPRERTYTCVDVKPDLKARERAHRIIHALAKTDFVSELGATKEDGDRFAYFRFDAEAFAVFKEWSVELNERIVAEPNQRIKQHLSKYRSFMASLAGIFFLAQIVDQPMNLPRPKAIGREHALRAVQWCDFFEGHARYIYGLLSSERATCALAAKIQAGDLPDGFTARDVYRKGWSSLNSTKSAQAACAELVEQDWLREVVVPGASQQKTVTKYVINPALKKIF